MATTPTPKNVRLEALTATSSKDDEIAFIRKVQKIAGGNDTYIGTLLGTGLMEWLESQIKADFSTDLLAEYYLQQSKYITLQEKLAKHVQTLHDRDAEIETLKVHEGDQARDLMLATDMVRSQEETIKQLRHFESDYVNIKYAHEEFRKIYLQEQADSRAVIEALLKGGDEAEMVATALRAGRAQQLHDDVQRGM